MPNITGATQFFPKAAENSVTLALGVSIAASATTVQVTNINTNYSNGDTVVLTIDPATPAVKQVFTGQVLTGTVINVIWTEGINQPHTIGAVIIDYTSATHQNLMQKGLSVQHNQDGTHGAITASSAIVTGNVTVAGTNQDQGTNLQTIRAETSMGDFVSFGTYWAFVSGLQATMASGIVYIGGKRIIVNAIANQTFTTSKDTYISVDNTGTVNYTAVTNGATTPALPANSIWVAIVVTNTIIIYSISDVRTLSFNSPWQLYGPTITAGSGTFTTVSATNCYFKRIGTTVQLSIQINVANNGTAASSVIATLPFPANTAGGRYFVAYGREDSSTGKMLQGVIRGSGLVLTIFDYINNYPVGGSGTILMYATYEAA